MRLSVVYDDGGHIVSMARLANDSPGASQRAPQIALRPGEHQKVATVDVDGGWQDRPLAEIHRAFTVVEGPDGVRLRQRGAAP